MKIRKEKEKGITPSRDRVVTDYNRDDSCMLLPISALQGAHTVIY